MLHVAALTRVARIGPLPSGKAPGFGPGIRGFESLRPSHMEFSLNPPLGYMVDLALWYYLLLF